MVQFRSASSNGETRRQQQKRRWSERDRGAEDEEAVDASPNEAGLRQVLAKRDGYLEWAELLPDHLVNDQQRGDFVAWVRQEYEQTELQMQLYEQDVANRGPTFAKRQCRKRLCRELHRRLHSKKVLGDLWLSWSL